MTTASIVTIIRILLIPVVMVAAKSGTVSGDTIALIIFILASITDGLDGYIARHYNQISNLGIFLDPLADKLLVTAAILLFVQRGIMSDVAAMIIIAREFIVTSLRIVAMGEGIVIAAKFAGKLKTVIQFVVISLLFTPFKDIVLVSGITLGTVGIWIMVLATVISGAAYFKIPANYSPQRRNKMKLFNSMTRQKEEFVPVSPGEVKIYSCGPTVYNFFHIGNARPFIVFDVLRRYFEYSGYKVTFVQNFTDVDDKVINKANEEGVPFEVIADRYIKEYFTDAKGLGIREATVHPKATENIDAIIEIVQTLVDKGYAYPVEGDVYYRARKFEGYGKLSKQPLEDLEAGARIGVDERKEDPMDFALWKAAKPGEPSWDSPWGKGRPGWHIECSAMANRYLGKTIDIHSGGVDLTFPHHENEIAQSEAANGCPFANYWMHNAFLNIDNHKMSKSAGNFFTVRDAAGVYGYEPIRFFMLSAHYRSPINYSRESLEQASAALTRMYSAKERILFLVENGADGESSESEKNTLSALDALEEKFRAAMDDDLNTADAIAVLFEMIRAINSELDGTPTRAFAKAAADKFFALTEVLGLVQSEQEDDLSKEVEELIAARQAARKEKNFAEADRIRDLLRDMGIVLEDTPQGVKWKKA